MSFLEQLEQANKLTEVNQWEGTFREFLDVCKNGKHSNIGVTSHQRVYNMIMAAGTEKVDHFGKERIRYAFFEDYLYGIEDTIDALMKYVHSASQRTETSRRMLLLYGPPSSGKCLAGDSLVYDSLTGQQIRLDDVVLHGRKACVYAVDSSGKMKLSGITARQSNGIKQTFVLRTALGNKIKATSNHKFLTFEGWKQLSEISPGDRIAVPKSLPEPMKIKDMPDHEVRFVAYMLSEGNCRTMVRFSNSEEDIKSEFILDAIKTGQDIDPEIKLYPRIDNNLSLRISKDRTDSRKKHPLIVFLKNLGLWGKLSREKSISNQILSLSNQSLAMFLGRLYSCDGHISHNTVNYASASYQLVKDLSMLLRRFGIIGKVRYKLAKYKSKDGRVKAFDSWCLDITDSSSVECYYKHIAPHLIGQKYKDFEQFWKSFSNKTHTPCGDVFPSSVRTLIKSEMQLKGMPVHSRNYREKGLNFLRTDRSDRNVSRVKLQKVAIALKSDNLQQIVDSDIYYDKVVSITEGQLVEVFDIEVPKYHNFVVNGIIAHNSEIVSLIKKGLEAYSQTEAGATFAIKGSKMNENPFMLVPNNLRDEFAAEYGVSIEGKLSPITQWYLDHEFKGKFMDMPVTRVFFSEAARVGIGTWLPSDPKCLTTNCLLLTEKGFVRGEDAFMHSSSNLDVIGGDLKTTHVRNVFDNGIRPVYQMRMRGMSIEATENHRFLAVNEDGEFEWVDVANSLGRSILMVIGNNLFPAENPQLIAIDESVYSNKHHEVKIPTTINSRLAKMAGYLVAEGYCDNNQISFCNQDENLNKDYGSILESEFACYKKIDEKKVLQKTGEYNSIQRGIVVNKQKIVDFINNNFETNKNACDKRVPKCILSSSRECQISFLEGLYLGDGSTYVRDNTANVSISSCSVRLIEDVQTMLMNLGVYSLISPYVDKKYPMNTQYKLTSEGSDAIVLSELLPEFMRHRMNPDEWKLATKNHRFCYESFGSLKGLIKEIRESTQVDRRYMIDTNNGRSPTRQALEKWLKYLESDQCKWVCPEKPKFIIEKIKNLLQNRFVPVISVDYVGHKPVYDISVDNRDHSFIVNGIVSHNSQDISELVGGLDFARIQEVGEESDPRAYNFDGELCVANRGIMEFIEGLKADERFLRTNLIATQEKAIKAPRFGLISVDCMIIMHTNEEEFTKFMGNKAYEAYHDRMYIEGVPYNVAIDNEVKIYEKLLRRSDALNDIHISPHTLESASVCSVLSRMEPNEKEHLLKKMRLYNKEHVRGRKVEEVPDMKKKAPREGMDGISPRFVIDQISGAISKARKEDRDYVLPLDILRELNEAVFKRDTFTEDQKARYEEYISMARDELNDAIRNDIQKAFFLTFDDDAKALCETYLDHVEASLENRKPRDPVTGDEVEVDEKLMESIENQISVTSSGRQDFRNEIMRAFASAARKSHPFDYTDHAQLKEAIQKQLFEERQGAIRMTVSSRNPDPEALRRINGVIDRMCDQQGYTAASANEILKYASNHLFEK